MLKKHLLLSSIISLFSLFLSAEKTVIIMGAPGSGKGTQTTLLRDALKWPLIAPATILREQRKQKNSVALLKEQYGDNETLNNYIKLGIITSRLAAHDARQGIFFDNWPKDEQSIELAKQAYFKHDEPLLIELKVDEEKLIERALQRRVCLNSQCGKSFAFNEVSSGHCSTCGSDIVQRVGDNKDNFPKRLKGYKKRKEETHTIYRNLGYVIHEIDGDRDKQTVHQDIMKLVNEYLLK